MKSRAAAFSGSLIFAVLFVPSAAAAAERAGHMDFLFGLGSVASQEATIFDSVSVEADDGVSYDFRLRYHFTDYVGIEGIFSWLDDTSRYKEFGATIDSTHSDTSFYFVNAIFHFVKSPISPYVSAGFGWYNYRTDGLYLPDGLGGYYLVDIHEDGTAYDLGAGLDGRSGRLLWGFEVRYLNYEFQDFSEDWSRMEFSARLGFRL